MLRQLLPTTLLIAGLFSTSTFANQMVTPEMAAQAKALQKQALSRAKAYQDSSISMQRDAFERALPYRQESLDINRIVQQSIQPKTNYAHGAMVFVSLGMPTLALRQIAVEANKYGIPVMIQGFYKNNLKLTEDRIAEILQPKNQQPIQGGYAIDPNWFKRYHITQVPAFVVTNQQMPCLGDSCPVEKHDILYGNISLTQALEIIAKKGELSAKARSLLAVRGQS